MSDVLDYDKAIVESIHHVEDILVKFALQNYAAAGAVMLAYFTAKIPLKLAAGAVIGLGLVFTWAILSNVSRYALFWKMHRITRDTWLAGEATLLAALRADPDCARYLALTALSAVTFWPLYVINLLPAAVAIWGLIAR
jgi:hypothetical protein